jgi:BirA family biotin operon repressor/biotin-[acetyl-CoA-carboxylase] ligase
MDIERVASRLLALECSSADRLHWFRQIASTNDFIMNAADYHATICIAAEQTAGRGRRGRVWDSGQGAGIYLSMGWDLAGTNPAGLSLVCGLSVREALAQSGVTGITLKWPNDVLLHGAKLAGILVELSGARCVIGIGLNVTLQPSRDRPAGEVAGVALPRTSLAAHGYHIDAETLTANLIALLHRDLDTFCRAGFGASVERWNAAHGYHGEMVRIVTGEEVSGRVLGVDSRGGLCLDIGGERCVFHAGEVSMKPLAHEC